MGRQDCSESGEGVALAENTALELFQIGALLLGNENEAVDLVEETVAQVTADPCCDGIAAHDEAKDRLIRTGLQRMHRVDPAAFVAGGDAESASCIDSDDVGAGGFSAERLLELTHGAGRTQLRQWLEQLPSASRAVFVLRAVVGLDSAATAESLRNLGDGNWTAAGISQIFRQALCSLANSMVHAQVSQVSA